MVAASSPINAVTLKVVSILLVVSREVALSSSWFCLGFFFPLLHDCSLLAILDEFGFICANSPGICFPSSWAWPGWRWWSVPGNWASCARRSVSLLCARLPLGLCLLTWLTRLKVSGRFLCSSQLPPRDSSSSTRSQGPPPAFCVPEQLEDLTL